MSSTGKGMRFRPCIDIHNGAVKQIVGSSLSDLGDFAKENFVSNQGAEWFAGLYESLGLKGGHIIILNHAGSEYYEASLNEARKALKAYPCGLMIGGGINPENAEQFLDWGASHVIVTSYVFKDGIFDDNALVRMVNAVGKEHLVLDLSSRRKDGEYFITTDRWQKFTTLQLSPSLLNDLSNSCDEFLIHAVDVEGKARGIEKDMASLMSLSPIRSTYAGGVHSLDDLLLLKELGKNRVDVTIGSALKLFGGSMELEDVLKYCSE